VKIKRIIVHCSDSAFGDVDLIRKWHVKGNGWRDIGYNAVICNGHPKSSNKFKLECDGLLQSGRGLDLDKDINKFEQGAHARGFNSSSIGICLIGVEKFTQKQFETLHYFYQMYKRIIPDLEIVGHRNLDKKKTCPNFSVSAFKRSSDLNKMIWVTN